MHMCHALGFARDSLIAFCCFFIHSILPFIFLNAGSSIARRLLDRINFRTKLFNLSIANEKHVAIVGFGLGGLATFFNLIKNHQENSGKLVVRIFEKSPLFLKGNAYSTKNEKAQKAEFVQCPTSSKNTFSQCFSMACKVGKVVNGVPTADCLCPQNSNIEETTAVPSGAAFFTVAGQFNKNVKDVCTRNPVGGPAPN